MRRRSAGARPTAASRRWPIRSMRSTTIAARLAGELDQAAARTRALETANREVAQRIDRTIETIRGVSEPGG